jgi:lipopolysaccharide biosynthesis protein
MSKLWMEKKEGLISLLVLVGFVLALIVFLLGPVVYQAERYRAELRRDARVLQELRAIEAVQDEIAQVQHNYQERGLQDWVYEGYDQNEISLDVQRRVSSWLSNAQVQRITPVTVKADSHYMGVGVHVQFTATMEELLAVFERVESSRPLLVVERMRLAPVAHRRANNASEPEQRVTVQMTVQTYVASGEGQ